MAFPPGQIGQRSFEKLLSPSAMRIGMSNGMGCYPDRLTEADRGQSPVSDEFRHGYQYEAAAVFFSSDGNSVFAGSGTSSIDREAKHPIGQAPVGGCETLITKAIETALNAYFNERERWK